MDYRNYTVEDFILDARFKKWVLQPDSETNRYWDNWLAENPHRWKDLTEARKLLLNIAIHEQEIRESEKTDIWSQINIKIDQEQEIEGKTPIPISSESVLQRYKQQNTSARYWWLKIAAILILTIGTFFFFNKNQQTAQPVAMQPEPVEKSTDLGVKSHITLKDGSRVLLNAGSKISYLPNFSDHERLIHLEGEAYFEVAKDPNRPFKVYSGKTVTTALGTTFNISAYPEQENVNIALIEGKVQVQDEAYEGLHEETPFFLLPGEMATYRIADAQLNKTNFNEKDITSWVHGILYFHENTDTEVFSKLEKWYGVQISAKPSPKKWRYSAEFENESLENVLFAMGYSMGFTFEIRSPDILIHYQSNK